MPTVEKRAVSLPADHARYVEELVATSGYASATAVVRAGLRALQERDAPSNAGCARRSRRSTTRWPPTPVAP